MNREYLNTLMNRIGMIEVAFAKIGIVRPINVDIEETFEVSPEQLLKEHGLLKDNNNSVSAEALLEEYGF